MTISSRALWSWDTTSDTAVATGYANGNVCKTGLLPQDLKDFCGVPLQYYGSPVRAVPDQTILGWIRMAEDWVEQNSSLLLTQSWVASPPAVTPQICQNVAITPTFSGGYQKQGFDFDVADAAYDFQFPRAQDDGWMVYSLRYRPVQNVNYGPIDPTAIKQLAFVYPLLNAYFQAPVSWFVEDHDFGLVRLVPATNVAILPLFAMQLAYMGFSQSVPGGIWMQYTAGLSPNDYNSRYRFIQQLVLSAAAMTALTAIQGTINLGMDQTAINVDGLQYQTRYPAKGPFNGLIKQFKDQRDELMNMARDKVSGPMITTL